MSRATEIAALVCDSCLESLMRRARIKGLVSHGCHLQKKGLSGCNGRRLRALGQPVVHFLLDRILWTCFTRCLCDFLLLVGYSSIPRSNATGSLSPFPSVPMHLLSSPILYLFPRLLSHLFQHSSPPHPLTLLFALFHPSSFFCHQPPICMSPFYTIRCMLTHPHLLCFCFFFFNLFCICCLLLKLVLYYMIQYRLLTSYLLDIRFAF